MPRHHIEFPRLFLAEAARVLRPNGRLVMVEPAITPLSWPFYHFIHQEPVCLSADPLDEGIPNPTRDAFAANQAIPTLLIGRHRARLNVAVPELAVIRVEWLSIISYPLSGGFKPWCLLPKALVPALVRLEDWICRHLGHLLAFRLLAVMERRTLASELTPLP